MSTDNQLVMSLTPSITPNSIRIGCFFLYKTQLSKYFLLIKML
jgi:hypothetical protein